jgi:serine O-acetyltransferase
VTARRRWRDFLATPHTEATERLWAEVHAGHPRFLAAVVADARIAAARRGERYEHRSTLDAVVQAVRLAVVSDAFLAQCCYRAKAATQAQGIPLLPRLLHRAAIVLGQISIGDPVVVEPGLYLPHGQVVVDGITRVGTGVQLGPFVTIGLVAGEMGGPTIGAHAVIGTHATVIGPIQVGAGAKVGAGAVVTADVPSGSTVVGVPARVVGTRDGTRSGDP